MDEPYTAFTAPVAPVWDDCPRDIFGGGRRISTPFLSRCRLNEAADGLIEVEGGESFSTQMCAPTFVGMARVWLARRRFLLGEQQRFFFASSQVRSASLDHESLPRLRPSLLERAGWMPAGSY